MYPSGVVWVPVCPPGGALVGEGILSACTLWRCIEPRGYSLSTRKKRIRSPLIGFMESYVHLQVSSPHRPVQPTCMSSDALWKDYGSKSRVGSMSFTGDYPAEIKSLVDTFIFRYKLSHEGADKLVKCPPGIQWQVISPRPPKVVYKPNGFVMGRIIRATKPSPAAPLSQSCRPAPEKAAVAGGLSNPVLVVGNKKKVYTPPSSPTHPSPWADWVSASEPDGETTPRVSLVPVKVRNRSRTPVARRRKERNQTPAEMDVPIMVLDQTFLVPLEGDGHKQ